MLKNPSQNSIETPTDPQAKPATEAPEKLMIKLPAETARVRPKEGLIKRLLIKLPINRLALLAILGITTPLALNACGEEKEEASINYLYDAEGGTGKIPVQLKGKTKSKIKAIKYAIKQFSKATGIKKSKLKKMYNASLVEVPGFKYWVIISFTKKDGITAEKPSKSTKKSSSKKPKDKFGGLLSSNDDPLAEVLSESERDLSSDIFYGGKKGGSPSAKLPRSRSGGTSEPSSPSIDFSGPIGSRNAGMPMFGTGKKSEKNVDLKERVNRLPFNANSFQKLVLQTKRKWINCFQYGLKRDPSLAGKLIIEVFINKKGDVSKVEFPEKGGKTIHNPNMEGCIRRTILKGNNWKFVGEGFSTSVPIPIIFTGR